VVINGTERVMGWQNNISSFPIAFAIQTQFLFLRYEINTPISQEIWWKHVEPEYIVFLNLSTNAEAHFHPDGYGLNHFYILSPEELAELKATPEFKASEQQARGALAAQLEYQSQNGA
jgi:hypothetical protein